MGLHSTYLKCCWILLLDLDNGYDRFNKHYASTLSRLIGALKISHPNLLISLYYLWKYSMHPAHSIAYEEDPAIINNIILASLILSNKTFNDQSYTLKTWCNVCNDQLEYPVSLQLLNQLESHFLAVVNFNLNFHNIHGDNAFWLPLMARGPALGVAATEIASWRALMAPTPDQSVSVVSTPLGVVPPPTPPASITIPKSIPLMPVPTRGAPMPQTVPLSLAPAIGMTASPVVHTPLRVPMLRVNPSPPILTPFAFTYNPPIMVPPLQTSSPSYMHYSFHDPYSPVSPYCKRRRLDAVPMVMTRY